eukprot:m.417780 g.417780  ORF g.417780 m.417780 type:complete len:442 (-) comp30611_c0_seq1:60-1385(-)
MLPVLRGHLSGTFLLSKFARVSGVINRARTGSGISATGITMAAELKKVCVSAPGKLILTGEHSVVYGKPAVAASLDLRTATEVSRGTAGKVSLELPDLGISTSWTVDDLQSVVDAAPTAGDAADGHDETAHFEAVRQLAGVGNAETEAKSLGAVAFLHLYLKIACRPTKTVPSAAVRVISQLPVGAGLGSSAAYSVALAAGLLEAVGSIEREADGGYTDEHRKLINTWAFEGEKVIHGTPSGIDNAVSSFGGAIHFVKGKEPVQLSAVPQLRILLVNTKIPRSTMALVAGVRELVTSFPKVMNPLLDAMGELSLEVEQVLATLAKEENDHRAWTPGSATKFEALVDLNQHLLRTIGVGHTALDEVCAIASAHKAHAKLTGAGGGGCAFVVLPQGIEKAELGVMTAAFEAKGFEVWETTVGGHGVCGHPGLPFGEAAASLLV